MNTTEQNIIAEGNRLIAEFMGWGGDGYYTTPFDNAGLCNGEPTHICNTENLKFHSSWDWLMPVVEKIEELGSYYVMSSKSYSRVEFTRYNVKIMFSPNQKYLLHLEFKNYTIDDDEWKHPMFKHHIIKQFDFKKHGRLLAVFTAIVEFIKWYNQNK
jgi:hypothetical protein